MTPLQRMADPAEIAAVAALLASPDSRLDAFAHNPAALELYQRLGYRRAGTVQFRKGTFYCFEKAIGDLHSLGRSR